MPRLHFTFFLGTSTLLLLTTLATGCRQDEPSVPEVRNQDTTTASSVPPPEQDTLAFESDTAFGAVTGAPQSQPIYTSETRAALLQGVREFITVIDSNDQQAFWGMLSQRSRRFVDQDRLATQEEVWNGARQTLGNIEGRTIALIGGTRDSASLLVGGRRLLDSERVADPVIIHLLREDGAWKVMYPGLLYPQHHLRR